MRAWKISLHPQEGSMRKILASAMLALALAGGVMTFIASSNVAQAHPHKQCANLNNDYNEDIPGDPC
jgi:hypothetical protein